MAQLDANCTICECVSAPIDSIDGAIFFPSHLETSSFLNWMDFKVMLADFQSEH